MSRVRLGVIGAGSMGQAAHLRNYATEGACEIVAIAELRPKLREAVRQRYGIARAYADHRELLASERLDGIVASQQFILHGQLVPELLATGVPVLIEKPIGRSLPVAQRLAAASRASKGKLYVGYHKRSDPATVYAKQAIDALRQSGEIGKLRYVRACMPMGEWVAEGLSQNIATDEGYPSTTPDAPPPGLDQATARAHTIFIADFIHQVNLLRHLFGEGYEARYVDPTGVLMAVTSASGVPGVLEASPYETACDWQEHALVCFERGWVRIDLPAPLALNRPGTVTIFKDPGKGIAAMTIRPTLPWVHAMRAQARNFINVCRGETTDLCGADDACADLAVADSYIELLVAARLAKASAGGAKP